MAEKKQLSESEKASVRRARPVSHTSVNAASGRRSAAAPLKPLPRPPPGFLSKALVMKLHHLCANAAVWKTEGGVAVQCGAQGPEAGSDSGRCGAWRFYLMSLFR